MKIELPGPYQPVQTMTHSERWPMFLNVVSFMDSIPHEDYSTLEDWSSECVDVWSAYKSILSKPEYIYGTAILLWLLNAYVSFRTKSKQTSADPFADKRDTIARILMMPQIEQRTEDWYKESLSILSGSQYSTIFKGPRTRGQLVMEKAGLVNKDHGDRPLAVPTASMNAFSWGIRFEPVVQQLYMALTGTKLKDLGRLRHPTNPRLGASPDGLVIEDSSPDKERLARFVEFKAPVSRTIYNKVPEDYMIQMQIQMEVGGVDVCDYLEVRFQSPYKGTTYEEPTEIPKYRGIVSLIQRYTEETDSYSYRYDYSPLNDVSWSPVLAQGEEIADMIPWHTNEWYMTSVKRDKVWYETIATPAETAFWKDVEAAKRGDWTLPDASRKVEKKEKYQFLDDSD